MPPLVSAITIFYNAERFLAEAIESVLAQTYPRWELILADDGSLDGGSALARQYAERHPDRIRYIEHPGHQNRGMSASRNLGLSAATGELVAFLDADDVWKPEKLSVQVAALDQHPGAGMVCGASEYWSSWSNLGRLDEVIAPGAEADVLHQPPALSLALYPLGEGAAPCPSDLLLRRSAIDRVGGFEEHFRGPLQMYEDQGFLAKIYLTTPVLVLSACLDRYRQHADSCVATVTQSGQYHHVRQYFLEWLDEHVRQNAAGQSEVRQKLEQALWSYRHPNLSRAKKLWRRVSRALQPAPA